MQPDLISLRLNPDETLPFPPRRPTPQPAIVGIMNRVGLWGVWLATAYGAYSALIGYRWTWNPYFLAMMVIVGIMAATKKDAVVLETAIVVLGGVWAMLLFT